MLIIIYYSFSENKPKTYTRGLSPQAYAYGKGCHGLPCLIFGLLSAVFSRHTPGVCRSRPGRSTCRQPLLGRSQPLDPGPHSGPFLSSRCTGAVSLAESMVTSAEGSEGRRCGGYSFPRAAITWYHQLSGLKQVILPSVKINNYKKKKKKNHQKNRRWFLKIWRPKVQRQRISRAVFPLKAVGKKLSSSIPSFRYGPDSQLHRAYLCCSSPGLLPSGSSASLDPNLFSYKDTSHGMPWPPSSSLIANQLDYICRDPMSK